MRFLISLILCSGLMAQAILTTTTTSAAATSTTGNIQLTSTTGATPGTYAYIIDVNGQPGELVLINSISGSTLTVSRGVGGLQRAHIAGAGVTLGPLAAFKTTFPNGACVATEVIYTPWININTGIKYECTGGAWTATNAGGGGGGGGSAPIASTVVRTTGTRLTVTITAPIAFGVTTCAPGGVATIDVSSGTGPAAIGVWPDCTIGVSTAATITCTGCTSQGSTGVFPDGVFPLAVATATSGTWDATITMRGDTFRQAPLVPGTGVTFTQSNGFTLVNSSGGGGGGTWARTVITASGTWTKPATVSRVFARVWAGGSGGTSGAVGDLGGAGGSGGGFAEGWCEVSGDVTATVGAGGAGGDAVTGGNFAYSAGAVGGDSSFGTCLTALGGRAPTGRVAASPGYRSGAGLGLFAAHDAARPGASTGGTIGTNNGGTVTTTQTGGQYALGGLDGAPGFLATRLDQGAHGGGGTAANGTNGGWAIGGGAGGGGGAAAAGTAGVAGQSQYGGAGGTGGTSGVACTAGTVPGGGGGGGYSPTSSPKIAGCAGARGEIHVYYVQ